MFVVVNAPVMALPVWVEVEVPVAVVVASVNCDWFVSLSYVVAVVKDVAVAVDPPLIELPVSELLLLEAVAKVVTVWSCVWLVPVWVVLLCSVPWAVAV